MKFSQDYIEKVREANSIVSEISTFTELKVKGGRLFGLCPFPDHNEKTGSFSVSEDKQVYHCFGCKKSGNIITFIQALRGFSFPETIEYLANKAGIALPQEALDSRVEDEAYKLKKDMVALNEQAQQLYHKSLMQLEPSNYVKEYCKSRGLTKEVVEAFKIGFGGDNWDDLTRAYEAKKLPLDIAEKLGLIRMRKKGNGHFDTFRGRLIFPIFSQNGQCIGFGGRALKDDQEPKYLNSIESEVFHKGKTFYGLHETAKYIRSQDQVIVVEGYMDLIALYIVGIKNVVATLGTALTPDHARILHKITKNVVVLFDGDRAGQMASERSLPILLSQGLYPRICVLDEGQDPDDYVAKNGVEALQKKLSHSPELLIHLVDQAIEENPQDSISKIKIIDKFKPILDRVKDARLKSMYEEEIATRLDVDKSLVKSAKVAAAAFKKATQEEALEVEVPSKSPVENSQPLEFTNKISLLDAPKGELLLINLVLKDKSHLEFMMEHKIPEAFSHQGCAEIIQRMQQVYGQMPNKFDNLTASLMTFVEPPSSLTWHLVSPINELGGEGLKKMLKDCCRQVHEKYTRTKTKVLTANLKQKGLSPSEQQENLEQIMNIQKAKMALGRDLDS